MKNNEISDTNRVNKWNKEITFIATRILHLLAFAGFLTIPEKNYDKCRGVVKTQ